MNSRATSSGISSAGSRCSITPIHTTADGKRLLIIHGDQFDVVVKHARWLAFLGDGAYDFALWANLWFNKIRRSFGFSYWSLSAWAKLKVKNAVSFIGAFELALTERRGAIKLTASSAAIFTTPRSGTWTELCM